MNKHSDQPTANPKVSALLRELKLNIRAWENAVEVGIIPDRYRHEAIIRIKDGRDAVSAIQS